MGLIDARLYLPEQWTQDPERCAQADIPRQHQVYKTKHELSLEIVAQARRRGVEFEWVGMDGLYGMSMSLLQALDDQGEVFVADIHKDRHIYLSDPAPTVPASPAGRGRKRQRYHSNEPALEVQAWVKNQPESAWRQKSLREGEQGPMNVKVLHQRVWLWDKKSSTPRQWHLLVRREPDSPQTLKYSLSNAPVRTSVVRLARMQSQRYWIERAFQDAKSHLGMGHYQARKWQSWYRHMALVMMAYQFMLQERIQQADSYPLLSCYDIQILMARTLPSNQSNSRAVIEQIHQRHQKRQAAMDSAKRRRSRSLKKTARS